jgi:hypothetical protein
MEVKEFKKKNFNAGDRVKNEEIITKMKKEHNKLVKGMFEFIDAQGGWLDFCYRWFSDDPLRTIRLCHGEICELPMGIIRHLNNTKKKIRVFSKEIDPNARGIPSSYTTQSRVRFTPMDML